MKSELVDQALNPRGARRRRVWTAHEKREIVAESLGPGASMAEVARRHGVNANLVFTWRRQARSEPDSQRAAPVELVPVAIAPEAGATAGRMEIVLVGGERIFVGADVDAGALARVVKALSRPGRAGLA